MAYILNIDTATEICSVALANDSTLLASRENSDGKSHAKTLLPFIEETLKEAQITPSQLDAVAISMGPGSYTGLRIGTSTAKGLCYSLSIPLLAIPTLQVIAAGATAATSDKNLLYAPLLDARRMEVFTCLYDSLLQAQNEVTSVVVDADFFTKLTTNQKVVFCGNGVDKCQDLIKDNPLAISNNAPISAKNMVQLSLEKFHKQQFEDIAYFEPFYLKEYVAAKPHVKGLQ